MLAASFVMAGLVPAIHVLSSQKDVDTRARPGHDGFNDENIIAVYGRHSIALDLVMIRMLVADDAVKLVRSIIL
jgi:hypothetical protein